MLGSKQVCYLCIHQICNTKWRYLAIKWTVQSFTYELKWGHCIRLTTSWKTSVGLPICIILGILQSRFVLNLSWHRVFTNCFMQSDASLWDSISFKKQTKQLSFFPTSVQSTAQTPLLLQSTFETTSPCIDTSRLREFPPCFAADQISNKRNVCCCSSRLCSASIFPSFDNRRGRFHSATSPDWFSSTSYVEIPAAVVESEFQFADCRTVAPFCVINLIT